MGHRNVIGSCVASVVTLATLLSPVRAAADSWVVMIYLAADDETLEGAITRDVREMQQVTDSPDVTIVVEMDRGGYSTEEILGHTSFKNGRSRFIVHNGRVTEIQTGPTPYNSSAAVALGDFIAATYDQFPSADRYVLVLGDHGAAWQGCCSDAHVPSGGKWMSLADLRSAIENGVDSRVVRFDLIGFDQCLMASYEVARAIEPFGDYMVASEELEPGSGWAYDQWLGALVANSAMTPEALGRTIIDTYATSHSSNKTYTLSLLSLARLTELSTALDAWADGLTTDALLFQSHYFDLARARSQSPQFGESHKADYSVVDLGELLEQYDYTSEDAELTGLARTAAFELSSTVLHQRVGSRHSEANGLSIYLPTRTANTSYAQAAGPSWQTVVDLYVQEAQADVQPPTVSSLEATPMGRGARLSAMTGGNDLDQVAVFLGELRADGSTSFLGELPILTGGGAENEHDGGDVSVDWDGDWPMLSDGTVSQPVGFFVEDVWDDAGSTHALLVVLADVDPGWTEDVVLEPAVLLFDFDLDTEEGVFIGAFSDENEDTAEPDGATPIDLGPEAVIVPLVPVVTADDELLLEDGELTIPSDMLTLRTAPMADGTYELGLSVSDLAGNEIYETVEVVLESVPLPDGGVGDDGGVVGPPAGDDDGCGCRTPGSGPPASGPLSLIVLVLLARARRPRR